MATTADFTTPEGAILCLEEAYRVNDIEAAVRCKDFGIEARVMFERLKRSPAGAEDRVRIDQLAEVLELAFRKEIAERGFADMTGLVSSFSRIDPFAPGIVAVTEVCRYPDGGVSRHRVLVAETPSGWRVLNPLDEAPDAEQNAAADGGS